MIAGMRSSISSSRSGSGTGEPGAGISTAGVGAVVWWVGAPSDGIPSPSRPLPVETRGVGARTPECSVDGAVLCSIGRGDGFGVCGCCCVGVGRALAESVVGAAGDSS